MKLRLLLRTCLAVTLLCAVSLPQGLTPEQAEILEHLSLMNLSDGQGGRVKTLRVTGVNLQVVNGLQATNGNPADPDSVDTNVVVTNGLGNVVVGYNELGNFNADNRKGSHNLVVGKNNTFTRFGCWVGPHQATVQGLFASVSGGSRNSAVRSWCSVGGGYGNRARGQLTSVSGGLSNTADGPIYGSNVSSVSGGMGNLATGYSQASVTGGVGNTASSISVVSGGANNHAIGIHSTVSGGSFNSAANRASVSGGRDNHGSTFGTAVSGGRRNTAGFGSYASISGGEMNRALGGSSSISGGMGCQTTTAGVRSSISGGQSRSAPGGYDWVAGQLLEDD